MTVREATNKLRELPEYLQDQELIVTLTDNTTVPLENVRVIGSLKDPFWNYKENKSQ